MGHISKASRRAAADSGHQPHTLWARDQHFILSVTLRPPAVLQDNALVTCPYSKPPSW